MGLIRIIIYLKFHHFRCSPSLNRVLWSLLPEKIYIYLFNQASYLLKTSVVVTRLNVVAFESAGAASLKHKHSKCALYISENKTKTCYRFGFVPIVHLYHTYIDRTSLSSNQKNTATLSRFSHSNKGE